MPLNVLRVAPATVDVHIILGPFQTSNLTCAKSNANEKNLLFSLICIRFGTCKVRRLKRALEVLATDKIHIENRYGLA